MSSTYDLNPNPHPPQQFQSSPGGMYTNTCYREIHLKSIGHKSLQINQPDLASSTRRMVTA